MDASSVDPLDEIRLDPEGGDGMANLYPQVSYRKIEEILARPEYVGIRFFHSGDVPLNAVLNEILAECVILAKEAGADEIHLPVPCDLAIDPDRLQARDRAFRFAWFRKPLG